MMKHLCFALLALALAGRAPARAAVTLLGQTGTVEWRLPDLDADRAISDPKEPAVVSREFTVGEGTEVTDLGFYPSLTLDVSDAALAFTFSEGACCLSAGGKAFIGPVVTFTSLPTDEDLTVQIGDTNLAVSPADLQVNGNRIAVDLRGRDISGGHLTLLVTFGSNVAERATMALIGIGLIGLGTVRRRWMG